MLARSLIDRRRVSVPRSHHRRRDAGAGRAGGAVEGVDGPRIYGAERGGGQLLGEEAIDLAIHLARGTLAGQARILAPCDPYLRVLPDREEQLVKHAVGGGALFDLDLHVEEAVAYVVVAKALDEGQRRPVLGLLEIENLSQARLVEGPVALEANLDERPGVDSNVDDRLIGPRDRPGLVSDAGAVEASLLEPSQELLVGVRQILFV